MTSITRVNTLVVDQHQIQLAHALRELEYALLTCSRLSLHAPHTAQLVGRIERFSHNLGDYITALQNFLDKTEQTERDLSSVNAEVGSVIFWSIGRMMPMFIATAGQAAVGAVAALFLTSAMRGKDPHEVISELIVGAHTSGVVPSVTAQMIQGVDDVAAGMMGLPKPPASQGVVASSQGLIYLAQMTQSPYLKETPVSVSRVDTQKVMPVTQYEQIVNRIPRPESDGGQVRIDHYPDTETYVVYIGGTIDAQLVATDEPWDMTSNIQSIAEQESGSYRATIEAMRQAGIEAQDNVIVVGHSQGGLIAAQIAVSQEFTVTDVVAVGAPIGHMEIPENTAVTEINHTEDFIPALSGVTPRAGSTNFVVTRTLYSPQNPAPREPLMPAHTLNTYVETAKLMDKSTDSTARSRLLRLGTAMAGDGHSTVWKAVRK